MKSYTTRLIRNHKRILPAALIVVLAFFGLLCGLAPSMAYAVDGNDPLTIRTESSTVGTFSNLAIYRAQDGSVAYCLELGEDDPMPGGTTYDQGWAWVNDAYAAIACNGYPYSTTIAGFNLEEPYARAATQIALWMEEGKVDTSGKYSYTHVDGTVSSGTFHDRGSSVSAARALYEGAHNGSITAPKNRCKRYFAPGRNQDMLVVLPGTATVSVVKRDASTGGTSQPGMSFAGAEFTCVSLTKAGWTATGTTNGQGELSFTDVPLGKIKVYESKAPEGYLASKEVIELDSGSDTTTPKVVELSATFTETPISFDLEISKFIDDEENKGSGVEKPAAGVQFQIINNTTGTCIGTLATNDNGFINTAADGSLWLGDGKRPEGAGGAIPYCKDGYTIHEVEETVPKGFAHVGDWKISTESLVDGAKLQYIVDNHALKTHLQIVKIDASTQARVPLAGFEFQLLDAQKNPVTQDVWYPNHSELNSFTTDDTGCVTLPESLMPGTYYIREVATAAPYLLNGEDKEVVVDGDESLAAVSVASFSDQAATGKVNLLKTIEGTSDPLAEAEFKLVAYKEIVAPDGTVQAAQNQVMATLTTNEKGHASAENLPLGSGTAEYALIEVKAPAGFLLDDTPHQFTLSYNDDKTPVVETAVSIENKYTKLHVSKTDITGSSELPGAKLVLTNYKQQEVDSWTSTEEPHVIEHLEPGEYTLTEHLTPRTYDQAESVTFTLKPTGEIQRVAMRDAPIEIDAQIDKRQEIASKDGTEETVRDSYWYSVDFRSLSSTWTDEFTVEDTLTGVEAGLVELSELVTPVAQGDYDGLMNVWYKTDKGAGDEPAEDAPENTANATLGDKHPNPWLTTKEVADILGEDARMLSYSGWRLWKQDVPTTKAQSLSVSDLKLADGEKVVALRFEYGRVEVGFSSRDNKSELWTRGDIKSEEDNFEYVASEAEETTYAPAYLRMKTLTAYKQGTLLENDAEVHAYRNGGGDKLEGHDTDRVIQKVAKKKLTTTPGKPSTPLPKTGVSLPLAVMTALFATAGTCLVCATAIRRMALHKPMRLQKSFKRVTPKRSPRHLRRRLR